jgi:PAS domain S-box-containing protein
MLSACPPIDLDILRSHLGLLFCYERPLDGSAERQRVWGDVEALTGYDAAALSGGARPLSALLLPSDRLRVSRELARQAEQGNQFELRYRLRRQDGQTRWVRDAGRILRPTQGPTLLQGLIVDVTAEHERSRESARLQEALNSARELLQAVTETIDTDLVVIDGDGQVVLVNRSWLDSSALLGGGGSAAGDWLGQSLPEQVRANDHPALGGGDFATGIQAVQAGAKTHVERETSVALAWETRWLKLFATRLQGAMPGVLVRRDDTTTLKKAQQALLEQSTYLNSILDSAQTLGIMALDAEQRIAFFNPAAETIFGLTEQQAVGRPLEALEASTGLDAERIRAGLGQAQGNGEAVFESSGFAGQPERIFESRIAPVRAADQRALGFLLTTRDVTDERSYTQRMEQLNEELEERVRQRTLELESSRASLESAQQIAAIGSWEWDLTSEQLLWSAEMYRIFGLEPSAGEPPLETLLELAHPDDRARFETAIRELQQAIRLQYDIEFRIIRRDREERVLRAIGRRLDNTDGRGARLLGTLQDITERYRLMDELVKAKEAAEYASQAKSRFLANMSHEIRTPMNAIIGMTELVLETALDLQQHKLLKSACSSAHALMTILNDVLDVSKLESGKMALETILFSLPELLQELIDTTAAGARRHALELRLEISEGVPACVLGDPTRLRQVLTNLLSNAVKFTPEGSIRLVVAPVAGEDNLQFSVIDTGIGISAAHRRKLFERFSQADQSMTRRYGGTGLGTAIAKGIVEQMQGRIWVESEEGQGSRFHFIVPLPAAPGVSDCSSQADASLTDEPWTRPLRILLAEDIEINQELVELRLSQRGHQMRIAGDGQQALDLHAAEDFDLILMDVHMPQMSGDQAVRLIRQREQQSGQHIPIIMLTASVLPSDQQQCFDAGADDFVAKPIDFGDLYRKMARHFPTQEGPVAAAAATGPAAQQALPPLLTVNAAAGLRRWGDRRSWLKALRRFGQDYAEVSQRVSHSLANGQLDSARESLHALKGVAGNLGAKRLETVAQQLELALKQQRQPEQAQLSELQAAMDAVQADLDRLGPLEADQRNTDQRDTDPGNGQQQISGAEGRFRDPAKASLLLETLINALACSALDDEAIDGLRDALTPETFAALEHLLDGFELERAAQLATSLKAEVDP